MKVTRCLFLLASLLVLAPCARAGLTEDLAELQRVKPGGDEERELQKKVIDLVLKRKSPPPDPEGLLRLEGRAEAAFEAATRKEDFLDAAEEYSKAIRLAPWKASYYYNRGLLLGKGERYSEAIKSLELYLLAAPQAKDRREVEKKIAGFEYLLQKSKEESKRKTAEARGRLTALIRDDPGRLSGDFIGALGQHPCCRIETPFRVRIGIANGRIEIEPSDSAIKEHGDFYASKFSGTISEGNLTGTVRMKWKGADYSYPFKGAMKLSGSGTGVVVEIVHSIGVVYEITAKTWRPAKRTENATYKWSFFKSFNEDNLP